MKRLQFLAESTLLAVLFTLIPIAVLLIIHYYNVLNYLSATLWIMFTFAWMLTLALLYSKGKMRLILK